jgi:hypothetical protein
MSPLVLAGVLIGSIFGGMAALFIAALSLFCYLNPKEGRALAAKARSDASGVASMAAASATGGKSTQGRQFQNMQDSEADNMEPVVVTGKKAASGSGTTAASGSSGSRSTAHK